MKNKLTYLFLFLFGLITIQGSLGQITFTSAPNTMATLGQAYSYDVEITPPTPAPTFTLLESRPGMTINSSTGLISWTPANLGDGGKVTIEADNGVVTNTQEFYVYVSDAIACSDNMISYWKLDENSGPIYEDYANGHDASVANVSPQDDANGRAGRAKRFIAPGQTTKFLQVTDDAYDFSGDDNFAISMWFKDKSHYDGDNEVWIGKKDDGADHWWWFGMGNEASNNGQLIFEFEPYGLSVKSSAVINDTNWHHVVMNFHGSTTTSDGVRISVDGNYGSYVSTGDLSVDFTGNSPITIGHWDKFGPTNYFSATAVLDEIAFFNRDLSSSEITDIYNYGLSGESICRPGNTAPLVLSTPVVSVDENAPYSYTVTYGELDAGDVVTVSDSILPSWLSFNPSTLLLSGTPGDSDIGDTLVSLKLNDGSVTVYHTFNVTVNNVNDAPVITSTAPAAVDEDQPYSYTLVVDDPDLDYGDNLTLSVVGSLPGWLNFNTSTGVLSGTPTNTDLGLNASVDFSVVLRATDESSEFDEESITITVTNINDAPVINNQTPDPIVIDEDNSIEITTSHLSVTDVDNTYPTDFTLAVLAGTNYSIVSGNTIQPTPNYFGSLTVSVELSDGEATIDFDVAVTVNSVNDLPEVTSSPEMLAFAGDLYTTVITATDADDDDVVTLSGTTIPAWLNFTPANGVLTGEPSVDDIGLHDVVINLSDGEDNVDYEFTIEVSGNHPPVVSSNPATTIIVGELYTYLLEATDADGDPLTYAAPTLPSWLDFNETSLILSGTPTNDDIGEHSVELAVSDTADNTTTQTFIITVGPSSIRKSEGSLSGIYPIPANQFITFELANLGTDIHLVIFDQVGRVRKQQDFNSAGKFELSTLDLEEGLYIYHLTVDNQTFTGKFNISR